MEGYYCRRRMQLTVQDCYKCSRNDCHRFVTNKSHYRSLRWVSYIVVKDILKVYIISTTGDRDKELFPRLVHYISQRQNFESGGSLFGRGAGRRSKIRRYCCWTASPIHHTKSSHFL